MRRCPVFDRLLLLLAALALLPAPTAAQDWRDVTSFRQHSDESRLDVRVRYGAGTLTIEPGGTDELYRVGIHYDADTFDPITKYRNGRLEVGVEGRGNDVKVQGVESGAMTLALSRTLPLDVNLQFGAVEATLEMGGLRLSQLGIETGASDTKLRFSEPNPSECRALKITMGAAAFRAQGLANANCGRITAEGGVGDLTLDFSGEWRRDLEADITMALGSATLRVPSDVGVRVNKDTFLSGFSGSRFEKRDGAFYSDNWDSAERRLTVDLEGAFGTITVRWIAPAVAAP